MNKKQRLPVAIIGGGLSGLLTAYRLKKAGIAVKILEARDRAGGRIYTVNGTDDTPMEMGATWFGNQHQNLKDLLEELELRVFKQYTEGSAVFEASPFSLPQRFHIPPQEPSFRIAGGTSKLVQKLLDTFSAEEVLYNQQVEQILVEDEQIHIRTADDIYSAQKVICCLPPALLVNTVEFVPALPEQFYSEAKNTHTWMQESIKAAVIFKDAFWKKEKISTIVSNEGPVIEFYDHSDSTGSKFSLCGFLHPNYAQLERAEREGEVIRQLKRIFGKKAEEYIGYEEVVWKDEEFTNARTGDPFLPHQNNGNPILRDPLLKGKVLVSNSETSAIYGGYMEGAVYSANQIAKQVIEEEQSR